MNKNTTVLVTGAGGFIGSHLVDELVNLGFNVKAVDIKTLKNWTNINKAAKNLSGDLKDFNFARKVVRGSNFVFNLAADMGGMGFIETHKADCMLSVLINTNLLRASVEFNVEKYLFASSACAYAASKQDSVDVLPLKESDAYPAMPEDGYGWEKLFSERMCRHFMEDYGLKVAIPRFHNVYGVRTHYDGGREKAPAALCRKVAQAKIDGVHEIDIWGDGEQTRSFMHVDDCVTGLLKLMFFSDYSEPINLGSSELVSINKMVDIIEAFAEVSLERKYNLSAPQGVRGRNSDNTLINQILGWEPSIPLEKGLFELYNWVYSELNK